MKVMHWLMLDLQMLHLMLILMLIMLYLSCLSVGLYNFQKHLMKQNKLLLLLLFHCLLLLRPRLGS